MNEEAKNLGKIYHLKMDGFPSGSRHVRFTGAFLGSSGELLALVRSRGLAMGSYVA